MVVGGGEVPNSNETIIENMAWSNTWTFTFDYIKDESVEAAKCESRTFGLSASTFW